jgi:hypothetical protein
MEQYLVEIFLPEFTEEFFELVPAQREYIDKCMADGFIRSYSLAADRSKLWSYLLQPARPKCLGFSSGFLS